MDDRRLEPRNDLPGAARGEAVGDPAPTRDPEVADHTLHHPAEDDWRELRDIRIRSIRDTPLAFLEDLDVAEGHPESEWRFRGRRNAEPGSHQVVAIAPDGHWVATFAGFISQGQLEYAGGTPDNQDGPTQANVVGVWIDPGHRGAGLAEGLLADVVEWARGRGSDSLHLMVHVENPRAAAFYRRAGFVATGLRAADSRGKPQREMVLQLPAS